MNVEKAKVLFIDDKLTIISGDRGSGKTFILNSLLKKAQSFNSKIILCTNRKGYLYNYSDNVKYERFPGLINRGNRYITNFRGLRCDDLFVDEFPAFYKKDMSIEDAYIDLMMNVHAKRITLVVHPLDLKRVLSIHYKHNKGFNRHKTINR